MRNCENGVHRTAVVILAAGNSSRFGSSKMLAEVAGVPLLSHAIAAARKSKAVEVVVVVKETLRHRSDLFSGSELVVVNSRPENGLSSSIAIGINSLGHDMCSALILAGDQPLVSSAMLNKLMEKHFSNPHFVIAYKCKDKVRNPALFPRCLFNDLAHLHGDKGAQQLVLANENRSAFIQLADEHSLVDVDTVEDITKVERLLRL